MQRPPDSGGAVLAMGEAGASTACGGRAVCSGNKRYVRRAEAGEQEGMWRIPASRACAEGSARTGRGPSSSAACVVASARARRQVDGEKAHGGHRSAECVYASHASTFPVPLRAKITTEPPQLSGFCPAPRRHSLSSCRLQPSGPLSPGRSSRGSRRFAARAVRAFLFLFLPLLLLLRLLRGCSLLAASTSGRQSAEPVSADARHGPLDDSSLTSRVRCGLELPVLAPFSLLAVSCASAAFLAEPRERDEPTEGVSTPGALPWLLDVAGYRRASGREAADERRRGRGEAEPSRVPKLTREDVDGGSESGWREEGRQASGSAVAPLAALTEELVEAPVRSDRVQSSHGGAAASNADMHPWRSLLATGVANSVEAATSPFASQPLVGGDALGGQPASAASESPYLHTSQPPFGLAFFAQPACSDPSSRSSSPYPSSAAAVLSTLPESSRPAAPTRSVPASRAPETSSASPPLPPADASSEGSPGAVPAREAPPAPAAVPSALPAFCGEKEDLSACDVVKDGTCYILAASSTRAAELLGPPTEPAQPHADEEEAAKFDGKRGERGELKLMERPGPPTSEVSGTREERRANGESPRRDVASSERDAHAGRGPTDRRGQLQNVRLLKDGLRIVSRGRIVIDADVQLLCRSALYAEERAKLRRLEEAAKRTAEKKRKYRADLASGRNRGGARRGGDANRSAGPRKPEKRSLLGFLFSAPRREQDDLFSLGEHADADNAGELRSPAESSPLPPSVSAAAAASQVDLRPPARESHAFPPEAASSFTAPALAASSGAALVQDRVELCSGDVILFSPRSRLHCREIFLLSEREIVLQAGAEISANATSLLSADAIAQHRQAVGGAGSEASRTDASTAARQQQTGEAAGVSREPDALHLDGGSRGGPLSADADANKGLQAAELTDARRRPTADGSASTQDKRETSSASSSSAWGAIASLRSDSIRLRGGSYGGVGGRLAQATCQDEGADDPHTSLPTHELTYGSPFLPVHLGVAGRLVAESAVALAVSGPRASQPSDTRLPNALEAPERAGIEAPRGGGLVLIYAGDRLVLDGGRISASGEEGWHADPQTEFSASGDGPAGAGARGSGERGEKDAEVRASAGRSDDKGTRLAAPGDNGSSSARAGEVGADKIKGCRTKTKSCSPAETEATTGEGKAGDAGARRREAGARSPVVAAAPRWLQTLTQWLVPPPLRRGDPKNQRWPPRGAGGGDDEVCDTRSEGVAQRAEHNCEPGKLTFPPLPAQATAGSGGSILLISGDIHLSRPLEGGGRLVAQGGGCRSAASLEARFRERQGRREFLFPSHPATANAEGERRRRGPTPGAGLRPDTAAQGVMGASRGSRDPRSFTRPEALAWEVPGAIPQAVEAEGCPDDRRRGWSCRGGGRIWKERRRQAKHRQQQRKAATAEASEARREAYVDDWLRDQAWGDCAAGGGGRVALFVQRAHPLVPLVLATGGCSSVTSRADLLPCTCGGGGTIYSSFHKKLFVHNRLQTAVVSAASPFSRASPPPGSLASGADEPAKKRETGAGEGAEDRRESAAVGEGAGAAGDATEGPPPAGAGVTGGQEAAATPEAAARPAASAARGEGGHASRSSVAAPQPNVVLSLTEVTSFQPTVLPGCLFAPFLNVEIDSAVAVLPATTRCEWRGRPGKNRKNGLRRRGDSARDPSGQTASWSAGDRRRRSGGGLGDRDELDRPSAGERQRELERAAEALAAGAEEASEAGGENVAPVDMQRRRGATGGMPPARDEGDSEGTGTGSQRSTGNHERPEMPAGPKAQGNQRTSTDDKQTGAQPGTAERRPEDAETLGTPVTKNATTEFDDTATPTETCGDKAAAGDAQRPRRATEEEAREPASSAALPATAPAAEPVVDEERETRREKVATEEALAYASDTKVAMSQCGGENNRHEGQEDSKNAGTQEGSSEERRQTSHHRAEGDDEGDTLGERAEVLGDPELPSGDLVVVGTLLLHGGANGASLRVLQPLHLHAASGSVRLRQQSKLVFARLSVSSTAANADPRGHRRGGQATFSFCPGHEDPLDQADESHASPSAVSSPPAPLSSVPFSSFPASCRAPSVDLNFPILSASGSVQIDTSASVLFSPFLSVRGDDMSGGTSPFPASSALAAGAALALTPPSGAVFAEGELIIHGSVRASLPSAAFAASRGAGASRSVAPPVLVPLFPPPPVLAYGQVGVTLGDDVQRLQNMILFSEGVVRIHSRQESASEEEEDHRCDLRAQRQPANPCDAMYSFLHAFLSPAVAALKTLGDADPQVAKPRKSERERSELTPRPPRDMQGRKADQTPQTIGDRTEERGAAGGGTAASPHAPDCQAGSPAASPSGRRKKQAASAHRVLASDMPLAGSAPEACARSPLAGPSACGREEGDLEDSTHGGGGEDDRAHDARNGDAGRGSRGGLALREASGEPARWLHMQRRLAELAAHFLSALSLDYAVRVPVDRPKDPGDAEKAVGGAPTAYPSESRSASASEREAETNGDCGPPAETDRHCNANRKDMLGHVEDENCPPAGEASDLEQHAGDEVERLSAGNEAPPGSERANRPWEQATDSVDEAKPGSTNTADGDTKEGRREAEGKSREEESADTREEKVQRTGDEGAEPRSPVGSSVDASKAPERPPAADDRPREASAAPGAQPQLDIRLDTEGQVSQVVRHGDGGSDTPQSEEREQPRDAPKHLEGKPEAAGEEACTGEETSLPSREATDPVQRDASTAGGGSARPGRLTGAGEVGDNMRGPCERRASSGDAGQIGRSAMPVRADSARQQERDVRKEIRNLLSATQPTCRSHQDAPARIRALLRMGNDEDNARSVPRDAVAFWELVEAMNDAGAPRFVPPPLVELLLGRVTLQTETGGEACGGSRSSAASALQDESASPGLLKTARLDGAAQHSQGARDALAPPPDQGIGSYPLDTNCPLLRPFLPSPPRAPLPHSPSVSLASAAARGRVFALSGRLACGRASHPVPTWTPHGLLTAAWLCRAEQSGRDFDTLNQANVKCKGAADRRRDDGRAERGERAGQAAATGGDVERPPQHRGDVRTQPEQADAALEQRGGEVGGLREAVTKLVELPGSTYQSWDPTWRVESFDEARQGAARQLKARSESRGPETEDEHPGRRRLGAGEAAPQSDPDEDRRNAFSGEVERLCDGAARGAAGTETAETAACQPLVGDASPRAGDCPEQPRALSVLLAAPLYRKQSVRDRCFGKKKHTHNSQHRPTESRLPLPEQGGLSYHPRSQGALGGPRLSAAYPADRWPPLEVVKSLDGLRRAAAFSGPWRPGASPSASPHGSVHLPFDVLVYGHKGVVVAEGSRVSGAAVLLCGGTGPVKVEGKVTARARGCKPGEGPGAGSRNPAAPPQPPADVSRSLASAAGERNADPSSPAAAGVRDNRGDAVPSDPETVLDALSSPPSPTVASSSPAFCGAGGGGHVGRGGDGVDPRTGRLCVGTGGRSYDIVANALPASGAQAQARALSQAAMASESQRGRTSPQSPSGHGSGAGKGGPEARAAVGLRRRDTEEVVASSLSGENNGMGASRNSSGEQTAEAAAASEHDIDKTSQTAGDTNVSSGSSAATGATDEATGAPSPHAHPGSPIIPAERLLTRLPTTSASGGGGDPRRSGAGGGLVWLEGFEVEVSGVVEVDGADAEAMQDVPVDDAVRRALIEEEQAKKLEQAHGAAEPEGREASAIREQDLAYAGYRQWQALALPAAIRDVLAYELTMGMVGVLPMHGAARRDQGSAAEEGVDIVRRRGTQKRGLEGLRNWPLKSDAEDIEDLMPDGKAGDSRHPGSVERSGTWLPAFPAGRRDAYQGIHSASELPGWSLSGFAGSFLSKDEDMTSEPESASRGAPRRQAFADNDLGQQVSGAPGLRNNEVTDDGASLTSQAGHLPYDSSSKVSVAASLSGDPLRVPRHPNPGGAGNYIGVDLRMPRDFTSISLPSDEQPLVEKRREKKEERSAAAAYLATALVDPSQAGQGGGAGGSIIVRTYALKGSGLLSARGGKGGRCTGGGGGGGVVGIEWLAERSFATPERGGRGRLPSEEIEHIENSAKAVGNGDQDRRLGDCLQQDAPVLTVVNCTPIPASGHNIDEGEAARHELSVQRQTVDDSESKQSTGSPRSPPGPASPCTACASEAASSQPSRAAQGTDAAHQRVHAVNDTQPQQLSIDPLSGDESNSSTGPAPKAYHGMRTAAFLGSPILAPLLEPSASEQGDEILWLSRMHSSPFPVAALADALAKYPLQFAGMFTGRVDVSGGASDDSQVCELLQLPAGQKGFGGQVVALPSSVGDPTSCPAGRAGWQCVPCPLGYFHSPGEGFCRACTNKPEETAVYVDAPWLGGGSTTSRHCPYACLPGLPDVTVNPRCLPPFLFLLETFRTHAFGFGLLFGVLFLAVAFLVKLAQLLDWRYEPSVQFEVTPRLEGPLSVDLHLNNPAASSLAGEPMFESKLISAPIRQRQARSSLVRSCQSPGGGVVPESGTGASPLSAAALGSSTSALLRKIIQERRSVRMSRPYLTMEDLPYHVQRIILFGSNTPVDPWGLDAVPPPFLAPLVVPEHYAAFACHVNALCSYTRGFVFAYSVLRAVYLPAAALLLEAARRRHASQLISFILSLDNTASRRDGPRHAFSRRTSAYQSPFAFWRSIRARELSFGIKVTVSPCLGVCCLDVLDFDRNPFDFHLYPHSPMVILPTDTRMLSPQAPGAERHANASPSPASSRSASTSPRSRRRRGARGFFANCRWRAFWRGFTDEGVSEVGPEGGKAPCDELVFSGGRRHRRGEQAENTGRWRGTGGNRGRNSGRRGGSPFVEALQQIVGYEESKILFEFFRRKAADVSPEDITEASRIVAMGGSFHGVATAARKQGVAPSTRRSWAPHNGEHPPVYWTDTATREQDGESRGISCGTCGKRLLISPCTEGGRFRAPGGALPYPWQYDMPARDRCSHRLSGSTLHPRQEQEESDSHGHLSHWGGGLPDEGDEFLLWRLSPGVAAVFELQDGIRKLSTQFLLPHRLKASLCIFPIEGFVTTGDRCQRLAHLPSEAVGPQKFDAIQAAPPGRNTATSNTISGNRCGAVSVFLAAADRFARPCALSPYSTSTLRVPWLHQEDAWADGFVAPLESDESSADGRKRLPARSRIPLCGRPASTALTCTTGERASHHRNVGKPETFGSNSVPAGSASFEERASPFSARDRSLPGTARRLGYAGSAGSRSRESFDSPGSGSIPDSRVCSPPPPFTASVNLAGQESARRVRSGFAGLARLLSFTSSGSSSSPPGSCLESSGSPTGSQAPYPLSVTSPPPYQGGQTEPLFTADYSPGPLGAAATSQLTPASMAHYKPVSKYREFPEIAYVAGDTNVSSPHSPMSWLPSWVSSSAPASSSQSQSHAEPSLMAAPDSYPVHAAAGYLKTPDEPSWGSTGRLRVRRLRQNVMALVITELPPAPLPSHGSASGDAAATREDVGLPTLPSLAAPPSAAALTSPLDPSRLHPLNVSAASYVSPSSQRPGAGGRVARDGSRLSPTPSFSLVGRFDRYAGTGTASGGSGHGQSPSPFSGCYTEEQGSRQMSSPHDTGEVVMLPLLSETSVSSSTEGFGDPPQVPDSPRGYAATAGNESDSLDASPCSSPRGTQRRKLPPTVHTGTAVAALKGRQVLVPGGLRCDTSGTPQAVTSPDVLHGEQSHDRECAKVGVAPLAHVPAPGLPDVRDTEAGGHRETSGHWTTVMVERQPWPSAVRDVSQSATRNCGTRRHMYERLPGRNGMGAAATGTAVAAAAIGELRRRLLQSLGGTQAVSYPAPSSGVPRDGTTVPAPVHEALRRTERASYAGLCDLRHAESWTECLRAAVGVDREGVNGDERSHRGASEAGYPTFALLPYIEEETSSENAWLPLGRWIERAASAAQRRVWKRGQTNAISTILFATFTSLFILHGVATLVQYHTMYHASHPPSSPFSISSRSAAIPPLLSPDAPAPLPFHVPSTLSAASIQSIPVPFPDRLHLLVATLCPPFVEVFAIITGILFMVRGNPQQGKLFLMSLLASVPRHLIGCALRVWERPQYNFIILDLLELVFFLCLKTALLVAGGMCLADVQHQLETADDVSPDGVESIVLDIEAASKFCTCSRPRLPRSYSP